MSAVGMFVDNRKHCIDNIQTDHEAPQSPEGVCRAEVIIRILAVEEQILYGRPMTTVIHISRNSE